MRILLEIVRKRLEIMQILLEIVREKLEIVLIMLEIMRKRLGIMRLKSQRLEIMRLNLDWQVYVFGKIKK